MPEKLHFSISNEYYRQVIMTDREEQLKQIQKVLLDNYKKTKEVSDKADDKDQKITDPLKNMKAIVKHYGSHNRLI